MRQLPMIGKDRCAVCQSLEVIGRRNPAAGGECLATMKIFFACVSSVVLVSAVALAGGPVGVVSHVKVVSDKVADVSSLEAWKKSFIKDGMTDEQKMIAAWKSSVAFVFQDSPPVEFLHEACVHDAIKDFNVYGYGMCCCASSRIEEFARYLGLNARGKSINAHSVPEVEWGGEWHMLDASLVNYFRRADGKIAGVEEICKSVQDWRAAHPEAIGSGDKLMAFQKENGWTGWKRGPELLANCEFYDAGGWWPAHTHGWASTMQEYNGKGKTPFPYEYGYSQGYEVNIQLRRGERLTRNWFNRGLHVNGVLKDGGNPGCIAMKVGEGDMKFLRGYGDLNDGRVGSGTLEYEVPAAILKDGQKAGVIEVGMPTSYVYLDGKIALTAAVGNGGRIKILFSDNNGLDWREVATVEKSGAQEIDISKLAFRRYDYRLRLVMEGQGTGVDRLGISHAIQCSQRALPTLAQGENTISFSAGPQEGTVTIEGATQSEKKMKQVTAMDFHPVLDNIEPEHFSVKGDGASVTFPIATPGEMTRLRFGGFYRLRDARDSWDMQVSFDGGKNFKSVATQTGPAQGICKYVTVSEIPAGTKAAQVRWVGKVRNTTCMFSLRIDADYAQPHGGFAPVKITYVWDEGGVEKRDVHIAKSADEAYRISCASKPAMKSIVMELAD